jgi:hypothetical protein
MICLLLLTAGMQVSAASSGQQPSATTQPVIHFASAGAATAFYHYRKDAHTGYKQAESALYRLVSRRTDTIVVGQPIAVDSSTLSYSSGRGGDDNTPAADQDYDQQAYVVNNAGVWDTTQYLTQTFDANNNLLTNIVQESAAGTLGNKYKYVYTYSASGGLDSTYTTYTWSSGWVASSSDVYQYDSQGDLLTETILGGPTLGYLYKYTYTYNAQAQLTTQLRQEYSGGSWANLLLYTYSYTGSGDEASEQIQTWASGGWQSHSYYYYAYDGSHDQLINLYLQYNVTTLVYDSNTLITNTYNSPGQAASILTQSNTYPGWANSTIYWYQYDSYGNQDNVIYQTWNNSTNTWGEAHDYQRSYIFNSTGQYQSMAEKMWATATSSWVYTNQYSWWYGSYYVAGIEEIKTVASSAYPNPFTRSFTITFDAQAAGTATLRLYDISGRLLTQAATTAAPGSNAITWDAGYTLPAGVYIYELSLGDAVSRGKMVSNE